MYIYIYIIIITIMNIYKFLEVVTFTGPPYCTAATFPARWIPDRKPLSEFEKRGGPGAQAVP
jgi:hypothetical protein